VEQKKGRLIFAFKIIVPLIVVLSLFIGGVSTGIISFELPKSDNKGEAINASILIDFGDGKTYSKDMTINNSTIFNFLLEVQKIENISLETNYNEQVGGYEIKSITYQDKKYIHGVDGYWWLFYINDQFATTGADKIYVNNNDSIKWKYEKF